MKIKLIPTFILSIFCALTMAQEPHQKNALDIDELLKKNNPKAYKAMSGKSNYLVVANYRNGKRWNYFEGDVLRFKSKDGQHFAEQISYIDDNTFTIHRYNNNIKRLEEFTFLTSDVAAVYKNKRGGVLKPGLISMAAIVPFALIDWAFYKNQPLKNKDFLLIAPIIGVGNTLIFGSKHISNKQKMKNNKELKIVKPL